MVPNRLGSNKGSDLENEHRDRDTELLPSEVVRSEVNFLVFPFFALWDKEVKRKKRTEYKTAVTRDGKRLEISWTVSSNPEFGYPGPFDRAVHKTIEQIISDLPLPIQNPIAIGSLYSLCKRMGINRFGGSQYRKIKEALIRIVATTVISKGTFYSKGRNKWIEDVFHLYERIVFKGEELLNGSTADTNYLFLSSWYIDNVNANYVKPVDWAYYKSLKTPVTQRLYELLSVKFYGLSMRHGKAISYRYSSICELLPIARQKYLSEARRLLEPAHSKLKDTDFLESWDWEELPQEGKEKDWLIRYYPGRRAKEEIERFKGREQSELMLPPPKDEEMIESKTESSIENSDIIEQLTQRGVTLITAKKLVKSYSAGQIKKQVEVFDWLKERKSLLVEKNPGGFLRKAIEEDYQPPQEYLEQQDRKDKEQKKRDRRERWLRHRERLIKQDIDNWDRVSPEKRIEGRLSFWITGEKLNRRAPTPEQIEAKKQELIDSLPRTEEEKWEYLSQNYPDEPPEDFE